MKITGILVRDILDIIPIRIFETRHYIERAKCDHCGITHAENDLPKNGAYGKLLVGFIAQLHAARVPLNVISEFITSVTGTHIAKSTINNMMEHVGNALKAESDSITGRVVNSDNVGIDETGISLDGKHGWAWAMQSGKNISIKYNKSRGNLVMDTHMDKFLGVVTADGYRVYERFGIQKRQRCWSHEIRNVKDVSKKNASEDAKNLYADLCLVYDVAKNYQKSEMHSAALRRYMNA